MLAVKIPVVLRLSFRAWRALINQLRRYDVLGLDRRSHNDRRQADVIVDVDHRSGGERRKPPRYASAVHPVRRA